MDVEAYFQREITDLQRRYNAGRVDKLMDAVVLCESCGCKVPLWVTRGLSERFDAKTRKIIGVGGKGRGNSHDLKGALLHYQRWEIVRWMMRRMKSKREAVRKWPSSPPKDALDAQHLNIPIYGPGAVDLAALRRAWALMPKADRQALWKLDGRFELDPEGAYLAAWEFLRDAKRPSLGTAQQIGKSYRRVEGDIRKGRSDRYFAAADAPFPAVSRPKK
jgi:hypothetical protein